MDLSMSWTNFCITGLLNELRTVYSATDQGVWQRRTSQNNRPHLPFLQPQTFSGKSWWRVGIFPQTPLRLFGKMPLRLSTGHIHALKRSLFDQSVA